jgi:hypothetical protein
MSQRDVQSKRPPEGLTLKFVYQAQPSLYVSKPPLVTGCQKTLAALGNNDTPAMSVVIDHRQRWARPAASRIKQFLKNEPAQINARNAFLAICHAPRLAKVCNTSAYPKRM